MIRWPWVTRRRLTRSRLRWLRRITALEDRLAECNRYQHYLQYKRNNLRNRVMVLERTLKNAAQEYLRATSPYPSEQDDPRKIKRLIARWMASVITK